MFITCRRPRRLRSRMSPALLDPGGCPSVLGAWVLPSRMFFDTFGHRGVRALGSLGSSTLSRGRLAWPRVTGRLSSEVRPGVRVSGSRVRHVTTRDTSRSSNTRRARVARPVGSCAVGRGGTSYMCCRDVLRVLHTAVTDSIIRKNAAASSETSASRIIDQDAVLKNS